MPESESSRSRTRQVLTVLAALALVAVLIPVLARLFGIEAGPLAIAVSLMPWVTLACVVPILLSLVARAWWLLAASAAVAGLCVWWAIPMFTSQVALGEPELTVATVNLTFGRADAGAVVSLVLDKDVDVLVAQEVTPEVVESLRVAGLADALPHAAVAAEAGFKGVAVWSRIPLSDARELDGFVSRALRANVYVSSRAVAIYAVHPAAPGPTSHTAWDADMKRLASLLEPLSAPTLVVGDLNATRDHRAFRDIEALGFADAADQAGAGFQPTFPEGRGPFPVVAIDHAMVGHVDLVATSVETAAVPDADHRMLIVEYAGT